MNALGRAALAAVVLSTATVAAKPQAKPKPKPKRSGDVVDVAPIKSELLVLETDAGHFVAIQPDWKDGENGAGYGRYPSSERHVYFGDDKNLYRLRTWGGSFEGKKAYDLTLWDPRVPAKLEYAGGKWSLRCGDRDVELTDITGRTSARQLLDKATFRMPLWKREPYALARDDSARYYYVDKLYDGEAGFRVFVGPKGKLRELKMIDIARDSEGDIFATKEGSLRLVINKDRNVQSSWVENKQTTSLVYVPVGNNLDLIYGELGAYTSASLGTPCDVY